MKRVAEAMPDIEVWPRAAGQDIFLYVYFQSNAGSYAYRYRFTNGPQGGTRACSFRPTQWHRRWTHPCGCRSTLLRKKRPGFPGARDAGGVIPSVASKERHPCKSHRPISAVESKRRERRVARSRAKNSGRIQTGRVAGNQAKPYPFSSVKSKQRHCAVVTHF